MQSDREIYNLSKSSQILEPGIKHMSHSSSVRLLDSWTSIPLRYNLYLFIVFFFIINRINLIESVGSFARELLVVDRQEEPHVFSFHTLPSCFASSAIHMTLLSLYF